MKNINDLIDEKFTQLEEIKAKSDDPKAIDDRSYNFFIQKLSFTELAVLDLTLQGKSFEEISKETDMPPTIIRREAKQILVVLDSLIKELTTQ